jgi:2-keto-4-pentenoate hydratase/2-oxohepta-3-ene-1,7-dioic acid hydratase in catechol pathway
MRFVTFRANGSEEPGVLSGANVIGLQAAGFSSLLEIIEGGWDARRRVEQWLTSPPAEAIRPLANTKLAAPLPRPPKIFCIGLNYRDHAIESKMDIPEVPTVFSKYATAIIGPDDEIVLPKASKEPDYEAEFAFVIGKGGRYISKDRWKDHVFGYTIVNDVSARDLQAATSQWMIGKTPDTFMPMGPAIVTTDEVTDPHALDIQLAINGEVLQCSNTSQLVFQIPDLLTHLSSVITLEPGDIVSTGTPAGVGEARIPPRFLRPGDDIVVKIACLGELHNRTVAEAQV